MTDSNRTALGLIREAVLGVLPGPNPVIRAQRITGAPNLAFVPTTVTSNELREDRQVSDLVLVGAEAGGDEAFELSYGAQDDLFESALMGTWSRHPFREGANVSSFTENPSFAFSSAFTTTHAADTLQIAGHGLADGDGPFYVSNVGGALPAGLAALTPYWAIEIDANNLQLATSKANALVPTPVLFSDNGTGVHTLAGTAWTIIAVVDTSGAGGGTFAAGDLVRLEGSTVTVDDGVYLVEGPASAATISVAAQLTGAPQSITKIVRVGRLAATGDVLAATAAGNALTSTALNFTTLGLAVGDWIKVGDGNNAARRFATAADNIFVRITAITAGRLDLFAPSTWAADTGAGKRIAILMGDHVRNGVTMTSFGVEERFTAHVPETVQLFNGMVPNMLNLQLQPQAIMTGAVTFFGFSASVANPVAPGDYTNIYNGAPVRIAAPDNAVLNTSRNVGRLGRGANPLAGPNYVLEATIAINNNLRRKPAVGYFGAVDIGVGEFGVTGTLNTYFGNKEILEQVLTNAETSVDFAVRDNSGRALLIDLPRIKFASGAPDVTGKNQDVAANMGFQAIRHATLGYTMQVQRFGYAA